MPSHPDHPRIVIVGAGVGGLACAVDLARQGVEVTVLESASRAGGKLRGVVVGDGPPIDGGPTVFTMRWILESLFADAGASLESCLTLTPAQVLARHYWTDGSSLDLYRDVERTAAQIERFAGPREADGYRRFCVRSRDIFRTLRDPYISSPRPSPLDLVRRVGIGNLGALWRTAPLQTLWNALGEHFQDPRLRQLYARYATYCGSSPFLAPATLMLVAHVERDGVWTVAGGMRRVAEALVDLGRGLGVQYRYETPVARIVVRGGRACGVVTAHDDHLAADAVVFNGDVSALGGGMLGPQVQRATLPTPVAARSLSAVTWCLRAQCRGAPLSHHNVCFPPDYAAEFSAIFSRARVTDEPTVYLCAQDRAADDTGGELPSERLLMLINAPASGDSQSLDTHALEARARDLLGRCGIALDGTGVVTAPEDFERLFPGTGGALYGRANHGPFGSFARPGSASAVPGLYLAGGSAHPGPGVPMAAMSGRLAAARVLLDLARA